MPRRDSWGGAVAACAVGGVACLIVGALLLGWFLVQSERPPDTTSDKRASHLAGRVLHVTPNSSRTSGWSNIAHGIVIHLNRVAVDVEYVGFGAVRAKDEHNRVIVSEGDHYLQVFVNIKNRRSGPLRYRSWYGNAFVLDGRQVAATLVDDRERQYEMLKFTDVTAIMGHTPEATIAPQATAQDVIIFAVPPSVDRRSIAWFHLDLPAAVYGGSGSYRFLIPRDAIQGF